METKRTKLAHYDTKPLNSFKQVDAFLDWEGDTMFPPDKDGDNIFSGWTEELMEHAQVRILIRKGIKRDDAVRALRKMLVWIETDEQVWG